MEKKDKIIIISSALAVVIVAVILGVFYKKRKKELQVKQEKEEEKKVQQQQAADDLYVRPVRNRNGELTNPISQLMGKVLIAKSDGTKIRTTPQIDNASWAVVDNNIITSCKKGDKIGVIVGVFKGKETPAMNWYKVKFLKPLEKKSTIPYDFMGIEASLAAASAIFFNNSEGNVQKTYNYGYVRSDVSDFQPYKK